jgi:adenylylsulfate kinase
MENLHPEFHRMLGRRDKERLLGQSSCVYWFYGLSGSGKSTLANGFERRLHAQGRMTQILDGDNIRSRLNSNLGFTEEDREENIRRIAEVARLYLDSGIITLTSFISPLRRFREMARDLVGADDFVEVYVKASYDVCAQRDPKGLYAKASSGKIAHFTGKDASFEPPDPTDARVLIIDTEAHSLDACIDQLLHHHESRPSSVTGG